MDNLKKLKTVVNIPDLHSDHAKKVIGTIEKLLKETIEIKNKVHHIPIKDIISEKVAKPYSDCELELFEAQVLIKRLQSALDLVDGTRSKLQREKAYKMHELGNRKPRGSKLDKHHDMIVKALEDGIKIKDLYKQLGVGEKTLYMYREKHNLL